MTKNLEKILKENPIECLVLKILFTNNSNCKATIKKTIVMIVINLARACQKETLTTSEKLNELLHTSYLKI